MFSWKPRPPRTIGEVIERNLRLVFTCTACKTITSRDASGIFYKASMELHAIESFSVCAECGASNSPEISKTLILTVEP